jgi:hypothetical protein
MTIWAWWAREKGRGRMDGRYRVLWSPSGLVMSRVRRGEE